MTNLNTKEIIKKDEYKIVNHWEKAEFNSNGAHIGDYSQDFGVSEHAGNYMNFTGPL
jgi:hypothetical protein